MCGSSGPGTGQADLEGVRQLVPGYYVIETSFASVPLHLPMLVADGVTFIDAGIAETPPSMFRALAGVGRTPEDIRRVALTHAHHDHFGGLANLKHRAPQVRVAVHRADVTWVQNHDTYWRELFGRFEPEYSPDESERAVILDQAGEPTVVEQVLDYGDDLELGDANELRVLAAGSHSRGSVAYYLEDAAILATGDALQAFGTPLLDGSVAFPIYEDLNSYRKMLTSFSSIPTECLVDAHRGVLYGQQIEDLLGESRRFLATFSEQLLHLLARADRPLALTEVAHQAQEIYHPLANRGIQLYVTTAVHLDELVDQDLVEEVLIEDRKAWAKV